MSRATAILVLLVGVGLLGGFAATAAKNEFISLPTVAEKIRKGEIDVGGKAYKAYGLAEDQRFHRIHTEILGLECANCHGRELHPSVAAFTAPPAVDVSPEAPGLVDRRLCLGCHLAGPGRHFYGPGKP
ncbi:MAG: hypothetical protein ACE5JQ_10260 [Candidatus Methylomirabilales bacterium]